MSVDPRLFTLYTEADIACLAADLADRREIAPRYNYVGTGAAHWSDMASWMLHAAGANGTLRSTLTLLDALRPWLIDVLHGRQVRVVDLGPGDGTPAGALLRSVPAGTECVGVDLSPQMLAVAAANLAGHPFVPVRRDFENEPLDDLRAPAGVRTVVLLVGGTLFNTADPAATLGRIGALMHAGDVLLCGVRLDSAASRAPFDLAPGSDALAPRDRVVLDLLGIGPQTYAPEHGYDPGRRQRYIRVRLTAPVAVNFGAGRIVRVGRGETIQLWRYHHRTAAEVRALLAAAGLHPAAEAGPPDGQFLLVGAAKGD